MSRAMVYVNLLTIILPSTLYAEVRPEIKDILRKANSTKHNPSVASFEIYKIKTVDSPMFITYESKNTYLVYGVDFVSQEGYLDLWSINSNSEVTHRWGLRKLKKDIIRDDSTYTVTLPVTHEEISSFDSGPIIATHNYSLTFSARKDYQRFIHACAHIIV